MKYLKHQVKEEDFDRIQFYSSKDFTARKIAERTGFGMSTIYRIVKFRTWEDYKKKLKET